MSNVLVRKYPYHVSVPLTDGLWSERYDWCREQFGKNNWTYGATCFYFKYEKDAVLYSLRWL